MHSWEGGPAGDLADHFGRSPNPNFLVKSSKMIAQLAQIDRSNRPNTVISRFIGPRFTVSPDLTCIISFPRIFSLISDTFGPKATYLVHSTTNHPKRHIWSKNDIFGPLKYKSSKTTHLVQKRHIWSTQLQIILAVLCTYLPVL